MLLPCNVVVRTAGEHVRVEIAGRVAMLGIVGNATLDTVAADVKQRLQRDAATLGQ